MSRAPSEYRGHPKRIVAHLSRALEQEEISAFPRALMDVVREYNVSAISERSGLRRETIYRALSGKQKPTFYMILKILDAVGLKLVVKNGEAIEAPTDQAMADSAS